MPSLLLVYGAAFVAAGFALMLQAASATTDRQPLAPIALALLAGFALLHGASEWVSMAVAIDVRFHQQPSDDLVIAKLLLLALSFALLYAFGSAVLIRYAYRSSAILTVALAAVALCAVLIWRIVNTSTGPEASSESVEAVVRYCLGIPACLSAALGVLMMRRSLATEETRTLDCLVLTAGVFLSYGVLAGIVVPRTPFAPASLLNASAFEQNVHIPVEVLRAACAITIAFLMTEAFVVEPSHRLRRVVTQLRADIRLLLAVDLNEPLGAIEQGFGALENMPPADHGSERERGLVRAIRDGVRRVRDRITDLLDVSELESHHLALVLAPVDLRPLLIRAADRRSADDPAAARVRLECPDILGAANADPVRVEQVLQKLLDTAREHTNGDSEILLRAEHEHDAICISVTSRGNGVPAYEQPYVFSREHRDEQDPRGASPHAGLGLRLARGLVEAMGGHISVDSAANVYLSFRFTLPCARPATSG